MRCPFCGGENDDDARYCKVCGEKFEEDEHQLITSISEAMLHYDDIKTSPKYKKIHCPRCGCNNLQATVETATSVRTTGGGYSGTKGCMGWLLFGPIGLLCGNLGQKQRMYVDTKNTSYWICSECGNKFRNLDDWKEEINSKENSRKVNLVSAAIAGGLGLLFLIGSSEYISAILLIIAAINGILALVLQATIKKDWLAYEELERLSTQ